MAEKINITFLGTSGAVPTAKRNHPATLLQYKDENILIDCGEGTQRQFKYAKLNPCKITKILITHWHGDHTLGLPGLLQTLILNEYSKELKIYGPKGTNQKVKQLIQNHLKWYLNNTESKGFKIKSFETENKFLETPEFEIHSTQLNHNTSCNAYSFILKDKKRINKEKLKKLNIPNTPEIAKLLQGKTITINNKKINPKKLTYLEKGKKITLITDTKITKKAEKLAENSDILICESTYSKDEKEIAKDHFHLTSHQAAEIAKNSNSKKLYLTHLSQRYETKKQQEQIKQEAKEIFKDTEIAKDLMKIKI